MLFCGISLEFIFSYKVWQASCRILLTWVLATLPIKNLSLWPTTSLSKSHEPEWAHLNLAARETKHSWLLCRCALSENLRYNIRWWGRRETVLPHMLPPTMIQNYVSTVQVQVWHYISVCLFRKSKEATTNTRWQTNGSQPQCLHHLLVPHIDWEWLITPRVRAVRIPLLCWWWRVKSSRYARLVEALRRSSCIAIGSSSQTSVLALRNGVVAVVRC